MNSICLILPGLYNSGPQHWQTHWENKFGFKRVLQKDWEKPVCGDWIKVIDEEVAKYPANEVVLIAHSAACAAVARWAETYQRKIKGALLVGPSDTEGPNYPTEPVGFKPMPLKKINFPTVVVASTNDEYVSNERAKYFADHWGSELIFIEDLGHINSASNLGDWEEGFRILEKLLK